MRSEAVRKEIEIMKNRMLRVQLTTVLLTLCMVLSLVPVTAFAATVKLPAGVSPGFSYNHTYHTKIFLTRSR